MYFICHNYYRIFVAICHCLSRINTISYSYRLIPSTMMPRSAVDRLFRVPGAPQGALSRSEAARQLDYDERSDGSLADALEMSLLRFWNMDFRVHQAAGYALFVLRYVTCPCGMSGGIFELHSRSLWYNID